MNNKYILFFQRFKIKIILFLSIFGPATIAAMADNDATGVATYAIAGAKLGYPILFLLVWVTILLGITQEMGMRLSLVTRKGLGDLIRENKGIKASLLIFSCLFISNMGNIIVNVAAFKTTAHMLNLPAIPLAAAMIAITFLFVTKGTYKITQNIMLVSCFFISPIFFPHLNQTQTGPSPLPILHGLMVLILTPIISKCMRSLD